MGRGGFAVVPFPYPTPPPNASNPDDVTNFHVGMPALCCELKLQDVSEMGYSSAADPPSGEVCAPKSLPPYLPASPRISRRAARCADLESEYVFLSTKSAREDALGCSPP